MKQWANVATSSFAMWRARTLADGREFDVVKVFWEPAELERRLRSSGWDVTVRPVGETFLFGSGAPVGLAD